MRSCVGDPGPRTLAVAELVAATVATAAPVHVEPPFTDGEEFLFGIVSAAGPIETHDPDRLALRFSNLLNQNVKKIEKV